MEQYDQESNSMERQLGLFDIVSFLGDSWKTILGIGLAGTVVSGGFLALASSQYEATALVEMAQISTSNKAPAISVEMPSLLIERLRIPSTYTQETIKACGLEGVPDSVGAMAKILNVTLPKNVISVVQMTLRRDSPELAKQCANEVFEMVRSQQAELARRYLNELNTTISGLKMRLRENQDYVAKAKKAELYSVVYLTRRDESAYLVEQIDELQRSLSKEVQARLVTPVYVSPKAVWPKRTLTLALGTIAGLMLGLVLAIASKARRGWCARANN